MKEQLPKSKILRRALSFSRCGLALALLSSADPILSGCRNPKSASTSRVETLPGSALSSAVIGKWAETASPKRVIEFFPDGRVATRGPKGFFYGTFSFPDPHHIRFELGKEVNKYDANNHVVVNLVEPVGPPIVGTYSVSSDKLVITTGSEVSTYQRQVATSGNANAGSPASSWNITQNSNPTAAAESSLSAHLTQITLDAQLYQAPEPDPRVSKLFMVLGGGIPTLPSALSPDGEIYVAFAADRVLSVWDPRSGRLIQKLPLIFPETAGELVGMERAIGVGPKDDSGHHMIAIDGPPWPSIETIAGDLNTALAKEFKLQIWNETGKPINMVDTSENKTMDAHIGVGIQQLAYSGYDYINMVNLQQPPSTFRLTNLPSAAHGSQFTSETYPLVYSPNGRYLAFGQANTTIRVIDAVQGTTIGTLRFKKYAAGTFDYGIRTIEFSPSGTLLAGGPYSLMKVFSFPTGKLLRNLPNASVCKFLTDTVMLVAKDRDNRAGAEVYVMDLERKGDRWPLLFELQREEIDS